MKSKQGQSMPITTMMITILGLIVLVVSLYMLYKGVGLSKNVSSCKSLKGVLIDTECGKNGGNKFVTALSFADKPKLDTPGFCCKKKIGVNKTDYDAWFETVREVNNDGQVAGANTPGSGGSSDGTDSKEINAITFSSNDISLSFSGDFFSGKLFILDNGEEFNIDAYHKIEKGNYCELYVFQAKQTSAGSWKGVPGSDGKIHALNSAFLKESNDCAPKDGSVSPLKILNKITRSGFYKIDYVIYTKKGGKQLGFASAVFVVNAEPLTPELISLKDLKLIYGFDDSIPDSDNTDPSETTPPDDAVEVYVHKESPKINVELTSVRRQQETYCWLNILVEDSEAGILEDYEVTYAMGKNSCINAEKYIIMTPSNRLTLDSEDIFCVKATQPYTSLKKLHDFAVDEMVIQPGDCDYIELNKRFSKPETYNGEYVSCDDFNLNECSNFKSRPPSSRFNINCYEKLPKYNLPYIDNDCVRCGEIEYCNQYKVRGACEENDCLDADCEWVTKIVGGGTCIHTPNSAS